jgi:dTDP-4-amino-4,6-dideoxygalactose transaminase
VDLVTLHAELEDRLLAVTKRVLATAGFVGGPMVEEFEEAFATCCDSRYCIGVSSGTDALRFALMAIGVEPGDAVITVSNTFIATVEAISQAGAQPAFVDVKEDTCNLDPQKLREFLESQCVLDQQGRLRTRGKRLCVKAIVPVHLYGQPADMDPILELAERYRLEVVEDACQAHGAAYFSRKQGRWLKAGSIGRAAAFSFYPGKNLGACGEAGAVTTNDEELAHKVRMLRDHGQEKKYYHRLEGYNGRIDALQAGFLSVKLPCLEEWNRQRRAAAKRYDDAFAAAAGPVGVIREAFNTSSAYHLYVISVSERDRLREHLASMDIGTGIHYPVPLHLQEAYKKLGYRRGDFPVTERLASRILSLPMFPQLRVEQQQRVINAVLDFAAASNAIGEPDKPASLEVMLTGARKSA